MFAKGLIIETALDPYKQQQDEQALAALLKPEGYKQAPLSSTMIHGKLSACTVEKTIKKADFHRAFQAVRQPGSAIKPILVYAPFFETGPYTSQYRHQQR